jgi:membrane protease YdiL (CAAX protease family)
MALMEDGKRSWLARFLGWLLPPKFDRLVPYSGLEVFLVVFLVTMLLPTLGYTAVTQTGLGELIYGPEVMQDFRDKDRLTRDRVGVAAAIIAFPLQLLSIPLLLGYTSRTRPCHFGVTAHRWKQNVLLGLVGWMVLTPPVLGLNWAVTLLFQALTPKQVTEHNFSRLTQSGSLTGFELELIFFLAMLAAPLIEEMLFRGVVQSWLEQHPRGSHVVMGLVFLLALPMKPERWEHCLAGDWLAMAPAMFVLSTLPVYFFVHRHQRTPAATAIFATSMLFGIFHASVWPSPIPLFVLALGLGWLARRTCCLVGPIVLHSLFNGVGCVQMLLQ